MVVTLKTCIQLYIFGLMGRGSQGFTEVGNAKQRRMEISMDPKNKNLEGQKNNKDWIPVLHLGEPRDKTNNTIEI